MLIYALVAPCVGGRWLDGRIMIKASFLLVKALRETLNSRWPFINGRDRHEKNIYCSITAEKPPLSRPWTVYSFLCGEWACVNYWFSWRLIIALLQIFQLYFFPFHSLAKSLLFTFSDRAFCCLSFGDLSAWNNVAVLVKQFLRVSFVPFRTEFPWTKTKILALRSSRRKALKHFFRVGHLIHTIIIFALASLNENSF